MGDYEEYGFKMRLIDLWERAYLQAEAALQDEEICLKTADKAVARCKKAVGLEP